MSHRLYRVLGFERLGPYQLRIEFDDGTQQVIDFRPVLEGALYGPLQDELIFGQVRLDLEAHTLVWPNGADFDPETLHDWPEYEEEMKRMARRWAAAPQQVR